MIKIKLRHWLFFLVSLLAVVIIWGCGQDFNSNSGDEYLGGGKKPAGDCSSEADARRCAAVAVLQARCFSCHAWSGYKTDADWVNADTIRVKPGLPMESELIKQLINEGGTMPQGGSALPENEYQAIYQWIEQM